MTASALVRLLLRPMVSAATWRAGAHLLVAPLSAGAAAVLTCVGLLLVLVTAPLAPVRGYASEACALTLRELARLDARRLRAAFGVDLPVDVPGQEGDDPAAFRIAAYTLLRLPVAFGLSVLLLLVWGGCLWLVTLPAHLPLYEASEVDLGLFQVSTPERAGVVAAVAAVALLAVPHLVRALATADLALARTLLCGLTAARLAARVDEVERRRAAMVQAVEAERRRIERDLHDGTQQQLLSLSLLVGRVRQRLLHDPQSALALVDEIQAEARQAIADLRSLIRGLHPPILADLGLDAALSALAARCPVPVRVEVALSGGLPSAIESIAYFTVAEALTNVAKHAQARQVRIDVDGGGGRLHVTVADDGVGGARIVPGSGLTGLVDRAAAVDGRLHLSSPPGGPTVLSLDLPCAS
ncbi:histidine kinase [Microbispora sp. KK1-11]|uniref:sensor histidine kinase n=1 Tax=Microbispora sp. KK1-11 TaxID=2053005 RepID=UPI0011587419|nr:histidine kinase [Microbispora sp. KK1-11]TQS25863.1 sensor histidine kinase [Microbispora sp. KK1-11]